jgi:hypothetical protein
MVSVNRKLNFKLSPLAPGKRATLRIHRAFIGTTSHLTTHVGFTGSGFKGQHILKICVSDIFLPFSSFFKTPVLTKKCLCVDFFNFIVYVIKN